MEVRNIYLDEITEFADFLSDRDHALQEVLDHLERVTLNILGCDSIILFQANKDNEFQTIGKSGISKLAQNELSAAYTLSENSPVADAIRHGKIVWLNPSPQRLVKYPMLKDYPNLVDHHTLIVSPIFQSSTPVSAFAIIGDTQMEANGEAEGFLKAISSVFALYFYRSQLNSSTKAEPKIYSPKIFPKDTPSDLTDYQLKILRLIGEEKTNLEIGDFLGYSEPAIRKEVIEIFSKLKCNSRSEAAAIFRSYPKA